MSENEQKLLALLKERSFQVGKPGGYLLASDEISDHYIDCRMTTISSEGAYLIGEILYERTKHLNIKAIGGPQTGAIPLTTATVMGYHRHGRSMEGFWIRDKAKEYGNEKVIEGKLRYCTPVVIVDDVLTRGSSVLRAVQEVHKIDCWVVMVLALVDRMQGAKELLFKNGVNSYQTIFTIKDFF